MSTRVQRRLRRLRRSPLTPAIGGALGGAVIAGAALALDTAWEPRPEIVTVDAGQMFLSAVAGAAITVTALLFWIRGMLVQLSAGQLSNRVVRWYLEDRFLLDSIGFLIAVFSYCGLVLLAMPAQDPAPPIATALAFLLTLGALVNIVVAIANSVHATDAGMILHNLSSEARAAIRDTHPDDEKHRGAPADAARPSPDRTQHVEVALVAPRTGWITEIDVAGLLDRMPDASTLECDVRAGSFVPEGHTMGHVSISATLADSDAIGERLEALTRCVRIEPRRAAGEDVEYSLGKIVDIAVATMSPDSADRTGAYEAIRHLGLALRELFTRPLAPTHFAREHDRHVHLRAALSYEEYLRRTFGHLRDVAADLPMLGVLVDTLGELRDVVVQGATDARLDAIDAEAGRLLDAVRHVRAPHDERQAILELAARHGWTAPELSERAAAQAEEAPPPSSVDDISAHEPEASSAS